MPQPNLILGTVCERSLEQKPLVRNGHRTGICARDIAAVPGPIRWAMRKRERNWDHARESGLSMRSMLILPTISAVLLAVTLPQPSAAQFEDVSAHSGLDFKLVSGSPEKPYILESMAGGLGFIDYDDDGWIDIYLVNGGLLEIAGNPESKPSNRLYRNERDGTFADVTAGSGLADTAWGMGVAVADFDNDGLDDLYVTNYGPNRLYKNLGRGKFRDIAHEAGVAGTSWSSSAAFGDYDRDGDVDLYVTNYLEFDREDLPEDSQLCRYRGIRVQCGPRGMTPTADNFYENLGDGRFRDAASESGAASVPDSYGLGAVWADYDGDGQLDLYVANDSTANFLFRNDGDKTFSEMALLAGVALSGDGKEQAGMGVDFGDYDNDGDLDLIVTNFSEDYNTLYRNEGGGLFRDVSYRSGIGEPTWPKLSWGVQFTDFDRDAFLDIVIADGHVYPEVDRHDFGAGYRQPNSAFRNQGDSSFGGIAMPPLSPDAESSRGLAAGDINNDGAVDLLIANLDGFPTLLKGTAQAGHWIIIDLAGTVSNRSAIGTRATVRTGNVTQLREVRSGGSYQSQNDLRLHFGLGIHARIDTIDIRWPSGKVQTLESVEADQILKVEEPRD